MMEKNNIIKSTERRYNLRSQNESLSKNKSNKFLSSRCIVDKSSKSMKVKSDAGFKMSYKGKSILKRKKSAIEAVIKADEDYEDDLYELKTFEHFKELLRDSSNVESPLLISPPKFPVTPVIHCKTPKFKDCFSPEELKMLRKASLEYRYRRRSCPASSEPLVKNVKKKLDFDQILEDAQKLKESIENLNNSQSDDDDDDSE